MDLAAGGRICCSILCQRQCGGEIMKTRVGPRRAQFGLLAIEDKFMGRLPLDAENRLERGWLG